MLQHEHKSRVNISHTRSLSQRCADCNPHYRSAFDYSIRGVSWNSPFSIVTLYITLSEGNILHRSCSPRIIPSLTLAIALYNNETVWNNEKNFSIDKQRLSINCHEKHRHTLRITDLIDRAYIGRMRPAARFLKVMKWHKLACNLRQTLKHCWSGGKFQFEGEARVVTGSAM